MKKHFRRQTLTGLTKQFPKNINEAPCTISYTEKMTTLPKGEVVDTNNLKPGEIIHMDLAFCNMASM